MNPEMHKIIKARTSMLIRFPFFGILSMKLKYQENKRVPTMGTNGVNLYYNTDFVNKLTKQELAAVLAHEVMHNVLDHTGRRENRNPFIWNMACDYAINPILKQADITLPEGHLDRKDFHKMSAGQIYTKLIQEMKENPDKFNSGSDASGGQNSPSENGDSSESENEDSQNGNSSGNGSSSDNQDGSGNGNLTKETLPDFGNCGSFSDAKDEQTSKEWKIALSEAVSVSQGNMPGNLKRLVEDILTPPLPWQEILRNIMMEVSADDYSWQRPNRRFTGGNIVLPSLRSEDVPTIYVGIDTSGSISDQDLGIYQHELSEIISQFPGATLKVIYCDYNVQGEDEFTQENLPVRLRNLGGGGTSFRPVFNKIKEDGDEVAALIYFTDLYGDFPRSEPDYPVVWVTQTEGKEVPFGTKIIQKL